MSKFGRGDLVWYPCPEVPFEAARVLSVDRSGEGADIEIESSGDVFPVQCNVLRPRFNRSDNATCPDNTSLVHLNDATILDNLQARHAMDQIYTYTASVLLAVNPYKDIAGLYGDEQCARYKGKHIGALPPHPYAIADTAYRALVREQRNQGLLISGESGAGKTETAKIVMQFLAYTSGTATNHAHSIQERVLRAQPILESLGNAVTMRNSNSSRFGKYNRVFFDPQGSLVDAGITTYLLESSRVVVHGERERTYHCFYEMLRGLDEDKLKAWGLERNRQYQLLTSAGGQMLPGFEQRDKTNFVRLCDALTTIGLDQEAVDNMFRVLAGLIHLGDMEQDALCSPRVQDDDEVETVQVDDAAVDWAAKMLGLDAEELHLHLTRKMVAVPGRMSYHEVPRTRSQCRHALQSFIKAIYKRLFDRTVQRINECFADLRLPCTDEGVPDTWRHIGILDIYGFENLQRNSFEQLCINFANEQLQQYFVENVLRAEQELYRREGLPWTGLALPDGEPVFKAIRQVFKTLDEYSQNLSRNVGNASDERFCMKVTEEAGKDPVLKDVLKQLKMSSRRSVAGGVSSVGVGDGFTIRHYAGQVEYNTKGWLDKNNDRLLAECEALICRSTDALVRSFGEEDSLSNRGPLFRSISKKYSKDLDLLLETLSTCNLHYIRCFKPNGEQRPNKFEAQMVLDQIVQCGTIELVKIMHDGYPNRCPFEEITSRFRKLLPERFQRYGMRTFIEALMLAYDVPSDGWALGMSRLFLKAGHLRALEVMRTEGAKPPAEKLDVIVRGIIRKRWVRAGHAVRLVNYLPKYLAKINFNQALKYLACLAKLASRLEPRLADARQRIQARRIAARRRLAGVFHTVHMAQVMWRKIRETRADRIAKVFRTVTLLQSRLRPLADDARKRVVEEHARREAQRLEEERLKREEEERLRREQEEAERLRLEKEEEERCRQEELRRMTVEDEMMTAWLKYLEEERRRAEEERLRLEEEERQRAEMERAREEEARKLREEEEQRQQAELELKRQQQELLVLQEEVAKKREEKLRMELERQREANQRAEAEKQAIQQRHEQERKAWEDDNRRRNNIMVQATPQHNLSVDESERVLRRGSITGDSAAQASTTCFSEEDDLNLGDSVSALGEAQMHQVQLHYQNEMKKLERDMFQRHEEILAQMKVLKAHNAHLEEKLALQKDTGSQLVPTSPRRTNLQEDPSQETPKTTPVSSTGKPSKASQRFSMVPNDPGSSRMSRTNRHSIASDAFKRQEIVTDRNVSMGGTPAQDIQAQRCWWAQQRSFLMDDLYGMTPSPLVYVGGSTRHPRTVPEEEPEPEKTKGARAMVEHDENSSANGVERNLNTAFETTVDTDLGKEQLRKRK